MEKTSFKAIEPDARSDAHKSQLSNSDSSEAAHIGVKKVEAVQKIFKGHYYKWWLSLGYVDLYSSINID